MRELKCQIATSLDLGKEVPLTTMASYFFTELERGRRKNIFKLTMTIKNVMDSNSPLTGPGILLNFIWLHSTDFPVSFFFFFFQLYLTDTHAREKAIR